jgi:hypothetical protein
MSDTKTDQEIMDEFYSTRSPNRAGMNWRDAPALDDDDDHDDEEALDLDMVIEELIGRIATPDKIGKG